jgi:hypothetical protein
MEDQDLPVHDRKPPSKAEKLIRTADEALAESIRRAEESGELQHLYGKPLEVDDDPDWLVNRFLKNAGFSHPLLEQAKELDEGRAQAEAILGRIRRRRERLAEQEGGVSPQQAQNFNAAREEAIEAYASRLRLLNRAIENYNLVAPTALHRPRLNLEEAIAEAREEIPPLEIRPEARPTDQRDGPFWKRLRRA